MPALSHTFVSPPPPHPPHCLANLVVTDAEGKGKSVPLQAWTGPGSSRKLRFPDFVTTAQDGGRLSALSTGHLSSSLAQQPLFSPGLHQKLLPAVLIPCTIPPISLPQLPGILHQHMPGVGQIYKIYPSHLLYTGYIHIMLFKLVPAAFTPRKYSWYSFLLEAESTPGP